MQPALLWKTGNRKKAAKSILKIFFPINSAINRTTVARNDWVFTELLLVLSGCVLESQRSCSKPCRSLPSAEKECAWRSRSLYQIASNRHYLLSCSSWGGSWHYLTTHLILQKTTSKGPELPITGEARWVQCHCRCGQECHGSSSKYQGWSDFQRSSGSFPCGQWVLSDNHNCFRWK